MNCINPTRQKILPFLCEVVPAIDGIKNRVCHWDTQRYWRSPHLQTHRAAERAELKLHHCTGVAQPGFTAIHKEVGAITGHLWLGSRQSASLKDSRYTGNLSIMSIKQFSAWSASPRWQKIDTAFSWPDEISSLFWVLVHRSTSIHIFCDHRCSRWYVLYLDYVLIGRVTHDCRGDIWHLPISAYGQHNDRKRHGLVGQYCCVDNHVALETERIRKHMMEL